MNRIKVMTENLLNTKGINDREFWKLKRKLLNTYDEDPYPVRDKNNKLCYEAEKQISAYQEHYKEILQTRPINEDLKQIDEDVNQIFSYYLKQAQTDTIKEVSISEIEEVLKELGKSKASGPNPIIYEMIKKGGPLVTTFLCNLFNKILTERKMPKDWLRVTIKSIFKNKGSKEDLKNQRGIFLSQTSSKLMEKLILHRIRETLESNMTDFQNYARSGRSTSDNLFMLRSTIDYYMYYDIPVTVIFYDLEKCFDRLWLKDCMLDLWDSGVNGTLWEIIYKMNVESYIAIKTPIGNSSEFAAKEVVKQGTILAANICANSVDKLNVKFRKDNIGLKVGSLAIPNLAFQDDIAQANISYRSVTNSLTLTETFQNAKKMKFNDQKTKAMIVTKKKSQTSKLTLNKNEIKYCDSYKYLGDILNRKNTYDDMVTSRMSTAAKTVNEIIALTEHSFMKPVSIEIGLKLFKAILIPRIFHNCETWSNIGHKTIKEFDKVMLNFLKRLLHLPRSAPNLAVFSETGTLNAQHFIWKAKANFLYRIVNSRNTALTEMFTHQINSNLPQCWAYEMKSICDQIKIPFDILYMLRLCYFDIQSACNSSSGRFL